MNPDELDAAAAEITKTPVCSQCAGSGRCYVIGRNKGDRYIPCVRCNSTGVCDDPKKNRMVIKGEDGLVNPDEFRPSTSWQHAGTLVEWAEENGKPLEINTEFVHFGIFRVVSFGPGSVFKTDGRLEKDMLLTPKHIVQAFVAAFSKDGEE